MESKAIEGFRLSPQQKRIWLLQTKNRLPYRLQFTVQIKGELDTQLLAETIQEVAARHEMMQTAFHSLPGVTIPTQVITDDAIVVQSVDWSGDDSASQDTRYQQLLEHLKQEPFSFQEGALLRVWLIVLSSTEHLLLFNLPALCADMTTMQILVADIVNRYDKPSYRRSPATESIQYIDFSEWQHEIIAAPESEPGRVYWRKQIDSGSITLQLPFAKRPLSAGRFQPESIPLALPSTTQAELHALCQAYETPLHTLLLACWYVLLWRLTEQANITIGTALAGRHYEELAQTLGPVETYLPISRHLSEGTPFTTFLSQIQANLNEASEWREAYAPDLVLPSSMQEELVPYLSIGFDFQKLAPAWKTNEITFSISHQDFCLERFDLKLSAVAQGETLHIRLQYDGEQYLEPEIQRLSQQWLTLLESVIRHPETNIERLNILTGAERRQILFDFNRTETDLPPQPFLHHQVSQQAKQSPANIAIIFNQQRLTYDELERQSNQLAHYLQNLGVTSETPVGICLGPSPEMMISILAILKAGGAYVPLDPTYPQARLAHVIKDAKIQLIVTEATWQSILPSEGVQSIELSVDKDKISQQSEAPPPSSITPDNLAYLIYTSGSTGLPKGVAVSHQNLISSTSSRLSYYRQSVGRFLLLSSFAFDSSMAGIFWTLSQGGTLLLIEATLQTDLKQLAQLIAQEQVTHTLVLPSLYKLLLDNTSRSQLKSLQTIIVAGEACPEALVYKHREKLADVALFNEYGPTEATVWSTVYDCRLHETGASVSIGSAIANAQLYVLDSHLALQPVGVQGELYIAGAGLARGYFNQPGQTAERFIPNPFSDSPGQRLYKTGDRARYRTDGCLEFHGRLDHQVKIHGFRVELGEIESRLRQYPLLSNAVVAAPEDESGHKQLVAYYTKTSDASLDSNAIRRFLLEQLPYYMAPAAFIGLENLPRMPNGKIDYRALPAPDRSRRKQPYQAPQSPTEETLADIWAEILGYEKVGVNDNFFDLGGDSIRSIQAKAMAQERGLEFTVQQLFQQPTIRQLSPVVSTAIVETERPQPFSLMSEEDRMKLETLYGEAEGQQEERN